MRSLSFVAMLSALLIFISCNKDETIDCSAEAQKATVSYTVDAQNPLLVTLEVKYTGEYTLDSSVQWQFGDGNSGSATGTTVDHSYPDAGTYTAMASIVIRNGDASCTLTPVTEVTINW